MKELQGLLKCSDCGYSIRLDNWGLRCHGQRVLKCCDKIYSNVDFETIREDVRKQVQVFLDDVAKDIIQVKILRAKQKKEIEELQQQLDNLMNLVAMGGKSAKSVHAKMEELQMLIDKKELENYKNYVFTDNLHIRWSIPIKYSRFTDEEKKAVCQYLIDTIKLKENGDLEIEWKVNPKQ